MDARGESVTLSEVGDRSVWLGSHRSSRVRRSCAGPEEKLTSGASVTRRQDSNLRPSVS